MKNLLKSLVALVAFVVAVPGSKAATECYLEVEDVPGECKDAGHVGHIKLDTFAFRAFQKTLQLAAGGGASPAGAVLRPLSVVKPVDKTSAPLFLNCVVGKHLKKVVLYADYVNEAGAGPNGNFFKIQLEDVLVAGIDVNNGDRDTVRPLNEVVTFSFARIKLSYRPVLANGTLGNAVDVGFDVKANIMLQ